MEGERNRRRGATLLTYKRGDPQPRFELEQVHHSRTLINTYILHSSSLFSLLLLVRLRCPFRFSIIISFLNLLFQFSHYKSMLDEKLQPPKANQMHQQKHGRQICKEIGAQIRISEL